MPVWHERTKALRASGKLKVIGITQEQHPERCLLFARWKGFDWPIGWDPFNITETKVVPRVTLIDEHGIVRATRANLSTFERSFVDQVFKAPAETPATVKPEPGTLAEASIAKKDSPERSYYDGLSALLWPAGRDGDKALHAITAYARSHPKDAAAQWRLGVAHRMRHDSDDRQDGDFQLAVRHWHAGLALDPAQYIYRRRIQQYGPRLDKPYPFYPWVAEAQKKLGKAAPTLRAPLTGSELAGRGEPAAAPDEKEPGGAKDIERLKDALEIESTIVWHTSAKRGTAARVHLQIRPAGRRILLWDAEAGPLTAWVELPEGWTVDRNRIDRALLGIDKVEEVVELDFEVRPPAGNVKPFEVTGYILFYACLERDGMCKYLRQDFEVKVPGHGK